jgi:small subunit ribosomal protein S8
MYVTDPIADMLTRIRNALVTKTREIVLPSSAMKKAIAQILMEEGYIANVKVEDTADHQGRIILTLKYGPGGQKVIQGLKRISKPGLRVYANKDEIPKVLGGLGTVIISTSKGIMTDREARKQSVGGEVLAYVW